MSAEFSSAEFSVVAFRGTATFEYLCPGETAAELLFHALTRENAYFDEVHLCRNNSMIKRQVNN